MPDPAVPSRPLETQLIQAIDAIREEPARGVDVTAAGDLIISAAFLRWFLVERVPQAGVPVSRVTLRGAEVQGLLDLSGVELVTTPCFLACTLNDGIDLTDARIRGFEVIRGRLRTLRADRVTATGTFLLRAPLQDPSYAHPQPANGPMEVLGRVLLCGAKIRGNLDLRGAELGAEADANSDHIALEGDGLSVEGNVLLSAGFHATGEIRLNGASISRNLDARGARFSNPGGYCLSIAGGHIAGTLYLCRESAARGFLSKGTLRLEGAKVDGDVLASGGEFKATAFVQPNWTRTADNGRDLDAVEATGLQVGAALQLNMGFHACGAVRLSNARIGSDLNCNSAFFDFPGEEALYADGVNISGSLLLWDARTNGLLRFVVAEVTRGFIALRMALHQDGVYEGWQGNDCLSSHVLKTNTSGIYAPGARIGHGFAWRYVRRRGVATGRTLWLFVAGAKADVVEDDKESWEAVDRINLRDSTYDRIRDLTGDVSWRLSVLDREYAQAPADQPFRARHPNWWVLGRTLWRTLRRRPPLEDPQLALAAQRFSPGPYLHLARVMGKAGYEEAANEVMVHMERGRTRYSGFVARQLGWRWLLDAVLQYGYAPFRPVYILLIWWLVSAFSFQAAYLGGRIIPATGNIDKQDNSPARPHVSFDSIVYAADTLVPLVSLNQKQNWVVEPMTRDACPDNAGKGYEMATRCTWRQWPNRWVSILIVFNLFFGWIMTTFFAAGLSGLPRATKSWE
jgi:hypothetical protein